MDNQIYYCENCGGVMEFDVETQSLKCPNCDTVVPILNEQERIVEHSLTRHACRPYGRRKRRTQTMECKGCGAKNRGGPHEHVCGVSLLRFQLSAGGEAGGRHYSGRRAAVSD